MTSYKGTKVTGTSTSGKAFPAVKKETKAWFYVGDTYTNTSTGHVYRCTTAGYAKGTTKYPTPAKWSYDHTNIVKKPNAEMDSFAVPKRKKTAGEYVYESTWDIPDALTSSKSGRRATEFNVVKGFNAKLIGSSSGDGAYKVTQVETTTKNATVDLGNFGGNDCYPMQSLAKPYTRQSFYPYTDWVITEIMIAVEGSNSKGAGGGGAAMLKINAPKKPEVGDPELVTSGENAGKVKCTIAPTPDTGDDERLRTVYRFWVKDVGSAGDGQWIKNPEAYSTSDDEITVWSDDLAYWQNQAHHYVVAFSAKSQGLGGDSGWTEWKYIGIGWPNKASIGEVVIGNVADDASYGRLEVKDTYASRNYPVDGIVLQKLVNTAAETPEQAANATDATWEDTDYTDNGASKALAFLVGGMRPMAGKRTWLRVKSWNDDEDVFATFSDAVEVAALYSDAPTVADNFCKIHGNPVPHGSGAVDVTVLWDSTSSADDDETKSMELSWADDADAWESTEQPEIFGFDWSKTSTVSGWAKMATVKVKGLEDDTAYWFRARCITEEDGEDVAGDWCSAVSGTPTQAPAGVAISAPSTVAVGNGIPVAWSLVGGGTQTKWAVYNGANVLAQGEGPASTCVIAPENYSDKVVSGRIAIHVCASTGGGEAESPIAYVAIAQAPALTMGALTLTAQPLSIPLSCTMRDCEIAVTVTAMGCDRAFPYDAQPAGDAVWTSVPQLAWTLDLSDHLFHATAELPMGCDFRNGATYSVEAVATDTATGLMSDTVSAQVTAAFTAATVDDGAAEVEAVAATDTGGDMHRYALISLVGELSEGEVYDVYRLTPDNCMKIAEGLDTGDTLRDDYAPFGAGAYRVAIRTQDGCVSWFDYDYSLDEVGLRFDFAGDSHSYVELPWDVTQQESYAKDFKLSKAMDGTQEGAWNPGVGHKGSYSTDVIKIEEQAQIEAVLDLARYAGPVFVRTSAGLAFCANANVDDFGYSYDSALAPFSFTADEIDGKGLFAAQKVEVGQ